MRKVITHTSRIPWNRHLGITTLVVLLLLTVAELGGCARSIPETDISGSTVSIPLGSGSVEPYVIRVGDAFDVKIFGYPNLNEDHRVRPDGKIFVRLIGDVQASGLTPAQLDANLTKAYGRLIINPEVAVIMRSFSTDTVFVGGNVRRPEEVPLIGTLTARQAIFCAGGHTEEAKLDSVILVRNLGKGNRKIMKVDLSHVTEAKGGDLVLQPLDILYVPETKIAKVDRFVDQYMQRIVPRSFQALLYNRIDVNPRSNAQQTVFPQGP